MLASRLNTIHNLWYFSDLMSRMRSAIAQGTFVQFREEFYRAQGQEPAEVTALADGETGGSRRNVRDA